MGLLVQAARLITIPAIFGLGLCLAARAQSASEQTSSNTSKSWTSTTESQTQSNINPTRTTEAHTESNGRTVDKRAVERLGLDGRYEPYLDIEKESVQVDATKVRTVERTFGRNPDGQKFLTQQTEEESRTLPGGDQKVVRTISNPDVNGRLQMVRREIQDAKQTSPDVRETTTTVLTPDINGGLAPTIRIEGRETQRKVGVTESRKSTFLSDSNGNWQLSEVREGEVKEEGDKTRTREDRILRPGTDGKLAVVERTVSKESETAAGEKRTMVESYSTNLPGTSGDGSLHLNQRVTTVGRARPDGGQVTEEQVEQRSPAEPGEGLHITQKTIDIVGTSAGGTKEQTRTVLSTDSTGDLGVVWIDTTRSAGSPAVHVDTQTPAKPQ
jgi:hypothetical protein